MTAAPDELPELAPWRRWSLAAGLLALLLAVIAWPLNPDQFLRAYLAAYLFYLGLTLGSMVILMIYQLTGGAWGFLVRRFLEAGMRTLPLMTVGFLPIALGVHGLYPWAQPSVVAGSKTLEHARFYLNPEFFWARAALYFGMWLIVTDLLDRGLRRQEQNRDGTLAGRLRTLAGVGLVSYGVGLQFASVDWVMSLQPGFHSTIIGPLMALGHLLSALALAVVLLAGLQTRGRLAEVISPDAINDLGSLLFSFVVMWSYMVWFQFMLIWIANLPVDVVWYLPRSVGLWRQVGYLLFVGAFLIPLFLLLLRRIKRDLQSLARVSVLILAMQLVYNFYLVLPTTQDRPIGFPIFVVLLPVGLGGIWLAWFLRQVGRRPLLAGYDFNQNEALRLRRKAENEHRHEEALAHG